MRRVCCLLCVQVKVDSKSRKDLTKYIMRKKKVKEGLSKEEVCVCRHPL